MGPASSRLCTVAAAPAASFPLARAAGHGDSKVESEGFGAKKPKRLTSHGWIVRPLI